MAVTKKLICLDFDGVIHSYTSGWQGAAIVGDPPVSGAIKFIDDALDVFRVAIYSSRSGQEGGIDAMREWLREHVNNWVVSEMMREDGRQYADDMVHEIEWPTEKPPAFLTIDDRAMQFTGVWPDLEQLTRFATWQQPPAAIMPWNYAPPFEPLALMLATTSNAVDILAILQKLWDNARTIAIEELKMGMRNATLFEHSRD